VPGPIGPFFMSGVCPAEEPMRPWLQIARTGVSCFVVQAGSFAFKVQQWRTSQDSPARRLLIARGAGAVPEGGQLSPRNFVLTAMFCCTAQWTSSLKRMRAAKPTAASTPE